MKFHKTIKDYMREYTKDIVSKTLDTKIIDGIKYFTNTSDKGIIADIGYGDRFMFTRKIDISKNFITLLRINTGLNVLDTEIVERLALSMGVRYSPKEVEFFTNIKSGLLENLPHTSEVHETVELLQYLYAELNRRQSVAFEEGLSYYNGKPLVVFISFKGVSNLDSELRVEVEEISDTLVRLGRSMNIYSVFVLSDTDLNLSSKTYPTITRLPYEDVKINTIEDTVYVQSNLENSRPSQMIMPRLKRDEANDIVEGITKETVESMTSKLTEFRQYLCGGSTKVRLGITDEGAPVVVNFNRPILVKGKYAENLIKYIITTYKVCGASTSIRFVSTDNKYQSYIWGSGYSTETMKEDYNSDIARLYVEFSNRKDGGFGDEEYQVILDYNKDLLTDVSRTMINNMFREGWKYNMPVMLYNAGDLVCDVTVNMEEPLSGAVSIEHEMYFINIPNITDEYLKHIQ